MKVNGIPYRTIWRSKSGKSVTILDQTMFPHAFETRELSSVTEAAEAIRTMRVRGAPLIGATAAYGMWLAMQADPGDASLDGASSMLVDTRPTAVNLAWAVDISRRSLIHLAPELRAEKALQVAERICDEDVATNMAIGLHGLDLIKTALARKSFGEPVNILTHCNAGWLACVDWGTALAPIYMAHDEGIAVHVWVDETRPRNQGASLSAFELGAHGVPHTILPDNAGGHLMQHGEVDMCIVGTDRTTATGDVANKIGTYLKALAADANGVPFYVALPHTTIDWDLSDGVREIEIEQRSPREVTHMTGRTETGEIVTVEIAAPGSPAANYGFDVTPARYVTGLITERGVAPASREGLLALYPERR